MNYKIIVISEAVPEDARGITLIRRRTWLETYPSEKEGITSEDIEAVLNNRTIEEETSQRAARIRDDRSSQIWVAKDNGVIIGFAQAQKKEDGNKIGPFYVLPDYHNKGIGHELMKLALAWLGKDKEIYLEVITYNTNAISFYKEHGFVENGITHYEPEILPNGKEMPQIEMIKKI